MKTIKVKHWTDVPNNYTGIVEWDNGARIWCKNSRVHREDGPAVVWINGDREWWLNDDIIWKSQFGQLCLKHKIIVSKEKHPEYSTVQVWKYIDGNGIQERIIVPGMEDFIIE